MERSNFPPGKSHFVFVAAIALSVLTPATAVAQTPVCNGKNVYPCSVGGTLLVLAQLTGSYGIGNTATFPGGISYGLISDPQNPGFFVSAATPMQGLGPALPSLTGVTFSLASASGQATITGASASVTCGVTGAAGFSLTLSTPGGPLALNCPKMTLPGATTLVTGQISFPPLSSLSLSLTLSGTAASASDTLTVAGFSAQAQIPSPGCTPLVSPGGQAFPAAGGNGAITITSAANCAWSVSNLPTWVAVTGSSSGTGNATVGYQVAANTAADRTAAMTVANTSFSVEQEAPSISGMNPIGSMPHVAAEGGWSTTFTLVNKSGANLTARTSLFGDSGSPLTVPLIFPQQTPLASPEVGATVDRTFGANASLILQASGPAGAATQTGSAQLAATSAAGSSVDGFAIFHFDPTSQEAVVPLETRNASSYLLAFDNTNGVTTGVAIENVSGASANIGIVVRDDSGRQIVSAADVFTVNGGGHTSFVLNTDLAQTEAIRGTIEIDTPPGGQLSVLGIRYSPIGTVTTIPVLANVGTNGGLMAHLASGSGWETTFVLVNTGASAAQAQLAFFDDSGNPLVLPLSFPQAGVTGPASASNVTQNIAPNASLWVTSEASTSIPVATGSAQLTTTGNVGGFVIFRYDPNGQEAVVPLESRAASTYLLAFDNTNGTATGVAISAASAQGITVPVTIGKDTGASVAMSTITLPPNGHTSFLLANQFPATAGIRGVLEFDTPPGTQISVLGIRSPPALTFTTLPALAK